ncbi:hypothetical protein EVAR_67276_1 [Eumeta japonica]|uniref:Uncharacterized protein n=1 Tax=Eumeta variegata TaxID=151549 RepID=A0A4C1ZRL9_EUMVA|nr:hypothetical protein EVAR_67276_1 [Eumeta japonica]
MRHRPARAVDAASSIMKSIVPAILITAARRQHVTTPWSAPPPVAGGGRAQHELFELLERVQCTRFDDQRAVLPPYFSQCCARGRPIIVEWERDARHSAGLSLVR